MQKSENKQPVRKLAILASGRGSNAKAIIDYFQLKREVSVELIVSNNTKAGVLQLADEHHIPHMTVEKNGFRNSDRLDRKLSELGIDLIVLAGFLWLIPERMVKKFPGKIVNIHPALLPKYGGKGMYGSHVHEAVKRAGDPYSGITIHLIDEDYDKGRTLFQAKTAIDPEDSATEIAAKVLKLEHYHYPRIIEKILFEDLA
jgi:phosphoribosylglycinamide formyltransferase-1